jgi:hypothetical protein
MSTVESQLEQRFIRKLHSLKYEYRPDSRHRALPAARFRQWTQCAEAAETATRQRMVPTAARSATEAEWLPLQRRPTGGYRPLVRKNLRRFLAEIERLDKFGLATQPGEKC